MSNALSGLTGALALTFFLAGTVRADEIYKDIKACTSDGIEITTSISLGGAPAGNPAPDTIRHTIETALTTLFATISSDKLISLGGDTDHTLDTGQPPFRSPGLIGTGLAGAAGMKEGAGA